MCRPSVRACAAAVFTVLALWPVEASAPDLTLPSAGESLPTTRSHRYRMAGRIRPLLFWIGRDDVGLAKLVWRGTAGGARGYEMLVGTDPAKAPRSINRWGFISEQHDGLTGSVLAVMSKSDEASLNEAQANVASGGSEYKAMRASAGGGSLTWQVVPVRTPTALTIREISQLLDRVGTEAALVSARTRSVAREARPGFLIAVAELVDRAVASRRSKAPVDALTGVRVPYVFGQQSYDLRLTSVKAAALTRPGVTGSLAGCLSEFEIRNLSSGERTSFEMSFATEGELSGVPVTIAWQPRWWLKVELALVE